MRFSLFFPLKSLSGGILSNEQQSNIRVNQTEKIFASLQFYIYVKIVDKWKIHKLQTNIHMKPSVN